jgi:adenylate cyclase
MQRRIAVILAADVAGYSRLVAEDEEGTLRRLMACRAVFESFVAQYRGRIFNTAGDAVLAEFPSAVEAVRAAVDIQEALRTQNLAHPPDRQMRFRIGVTFGDVVERDGDLLGDAVNIAARLQSIAEPGGVCVSRTIHEQVANKVSIAFEDRGAQTVKNIPTPVHVYAVSGTREVAAALAPPEAAPRRAPLRAAAALLAVLVLGAGVGAWWLLPAAPLPPVAASGPAAPFVAERVPFLREENRTDIKDVYVPARGAKALALNRLGYAYAVAEASADIARERALASCRASTGEPCRIYAVDDRVVWPQPHPPMPPQPWRRDVPGGGEPFSPARVPFARAADAEFLASFLQRPKPRALAVGRTGLMGMSWGGRTADDPIRRALEFCGDRTGEACLLVAVDDVFAAPIPSSAAVLGPFPAPDDGLDAAAREIVARAYDGADWRAVAVGSGGVGVAVGRGDEAQAAAAALAECRRRAPDCRVHAIGPFRVGPIRSN